jgi:nicotinamidase/pyrazinamidase
VKALLIVDMLADFIYPGGALYLGPPADALVKGVRSRLEEYRAEKNLVIYLCDRHPEDDKEFDMFPPHSLEGSKGSDIIAELAPRADERVIGKRRFSAFCGTDLDLT